ncbi:MAG: hypothetical protein H6Q64_1746 [Firmicutes bacterium]|nr:hypothetical protein [Bacillota bacterium]
MNWGEMIKVALEGIWVNKLRSALTILGIIIGVMAVIIVITIGQGGRDEIMGELESMGSNLFAVYISQVEDGDYERYQMDEEDCRIIKESVEGVKAIVPVAYTSASAQTKRKKESCSLTATDGEYAQIRNVQIAQGRFFNTSDNASTRRVVVINQKLADDLFGVGSDVLDQKIMLAGNPVMVIGVCKSATGIFSGGDRPEAYIPISLYYTMYESNGAYELDGTAVSKDRVDEVAQQVMRIMQLRHGDKDKKVYQFFNMEQEMQSANKVTGILTLIIGAIAGISLLVGGIGVMNIMLVSVTERTREIGIRIAIGACRQDIMRQFLIESTVLSLLGGLIGIILGMISAALICAAIKIPFSISLPTVLIASLFSIAVGIFFGLYPANRAAKLDPIDALRYE